MRGQKYTGGIQDKNTAYYQGTISCISCGCPLGSSAKQCKCKCHTILRGFKKERLTILKLS